MHAYSLQKKKECTQPITHKKGTDLKKKDFSSGKKKTQEKFFKKNLDVHVWQKVTVQHDHHLKD